MRWLAIVLLSSTTVHAEPPAEDTGYVFAATQLGLGAPLGLFGVEAGVGYDWFRASAGIGIGTGGPQAGATLRAFTTMSGLDVGVGLGLSKGPGPGVIQLGEGDEHDEEPMFDADTYWTSAELAVEVPLTRWSFARVFAGASYAVGGGCEDADGACDPGQEARLEKERWMPYAGIAAVVRFPEGPARTTYQMPPAFQVPPSVY